MQGTKKKPFQCDLQARSSCVNLGICFIFRKADSAESSAGTFPEGIGDYTGTAEMSRCQDKQLRKTNREKKNKKRKASSRNFMSRLKIMAGLNGSTLQLPPLENLWHVVPGEMDEKSARQTQQECSALIFALFSALIKGMWTLSRQMEMYLCFPTLPFNRPR